MNRSQLRKLLSKTTDLKRSTWFYASLIPFAATITAMACAFNFLTDHSVRFNSIRTGRAFYRLPPLPVMYNQKTEKEFSVREIENYDYDEAPTSEEDFQEPGQVSEEDEIWEQARTAAQEKNLTETRVFLEKYVAITAEPSIETGPDRQAQRNTAADILDAMSALRSGSSEEMVGQYINARYASHFKDQNIGDLIAQAPKHKNLNDNWEYLRAASFVVANHSNEAPDAFRKHAAEYPRSEKNEAVLYMIAKLTMESSESFTNKDCGSPEKDEPAKGEPVENCRDENWQAAFKGFRLLMATYPKGRYFNDARGWLAFLDERGGDRPRALAEYYRMLGHPTDRSVRLKAKFDLGYLGHEQADATLDKVEELIAEDSDAALAYAYHRIYNHAIDLTYQEANPWCCYGDNRWQQDEDEKKRVSDARNGGNHELKRVAKFATAMMKRHPQARVSGGFVLRLAEAQLELQGYPEAFKLAHKALNMGVQGDMRMEALWVKGSSEHQLKQLKSARATFKQLIAEFPKAKLTEGARRLLAITAEDEDDLETALEQYLALDYEYDVAYYVDVLLTTDRLAKFVADRNLPEYDYLLYALGVRYMRDKRWSEARETLRRVRTEKGTDGYLQHDRDATWYFAKEPDYEDRKNLYIKTSWVVQDLKTIDILEYYEQAVENAQGDENKAEAMYRLASSLFEADDLAFYNPAAWSGSRGGSLSQLQFSDHVRLPNESRIIFEHLQAHDPWARAIPIYLEIADRFPQTKTARDALYSAAVAHQRLSERNGPWGAFYQRGLFAGSRMVTYADVKGTYPDYQLPRGTYGWEPFTRTVNGGPGWAPKPTPLPKLTRTQSFERKFKRYFGAVEGWIEPKLAAVTNGYTAYLGGWFDAVLAAMGILLAGYFMLLAFHFRRILSAAIMRLIYAEVPQELLPDSDSRIEKVIGDGS